MVGLIALWTELAPNDDKKDIDDDGMDEVIELSKQLLVRAKLE
jgi:hypothetical protein